MAKLNDLCAYPRSHQEFLPDYWAWYSSDATINASYMPNQEFLPDYWAWYCQCRDIGSGHLETVNDILVAHRQTGGGRHWSQDQSPYGSW